MAGRVDKAPCVVLSWGRGAEQLDDSLCLTGYPARGPVVKHMPAHMPACVPISGPRIAVARENYCL